MNKQRQSNCDILQHTKRKLDGLKEQNAKWAKQCETLNYNYKRVKSAFRENELARKALQKEKDSLTRRIYHLQQILNDTKNENTKLQTKISTNKIEITKLKREIDQYKTKLKRLNDNKKNNHNDNSNNNNNNNNNNNGNENSNDGDNDDDNVLSKQWELRRENESLKRKLSICSKTNEFVTELQSTISKYKENNKKLQNQIRENSLLHEKEMKLFENNRQRLENEMNDIIQERKVW